MAGKAGLSGAGVRRAKRRLSYAVVAPARDEAENLARLARCIEAAAVGAYVRRRQRLRSLPDRLREARGRRADRPRVDVLFVCDSGGHLLELVVLSRALPEFSRAWVTIDKEDARSLLAGEQVYFAHGPTCRSVPNLVRNLTLAWRLIGRTRPRALVTTGAGAGVPFAWVARLRAHTTVVFVEIAGALRPSLSCRLVAPVADRVYVQWPELVGSVRGARFGGRTLFEDP